MALRILAAWFATFFGDLVAVFLFMTNRYLLKQDSGYPSVNFNSWNLNAPVNTHVNVQGTHKE